MRKENIREFLPRRQNLSHNFKNMCAYVRCGAMRRCGGVCGDAKLWGVRNGEVQRKRNTEVGTYQGLLAFAEKTSFLKANCRSILCKLCS